MTSPNDLFRLTDAQRAQLTALRDDVPMTPNLTGNLTAVEVGARLAAEAIDRSRLLEARRAQADARMAEGDGIHRAMINAQSIGADRVYISNWTLPTGAIGDTATWAANPYKPPRSENLDIHPRHGGDIPDDVSNAAHVLRNWMLANQCEMLGGMVIDRNAMYEAPRFTPVASPATSSTRHRWGQADRNGVVTCLTCHGFASARRPLPVTGCSGMTPQEARNASGAPSMAPATRSVQPPPPGGFHQWQRNSHGGYDCSLCGQRIANCDIVPTFGCPARAV